MSRIIDFFFSPYPTAQTLRLQTAIEDGLAHGSRISPQHPGPGEPVTLLFSTNAHKPIEQVAVYYTTDGSKPCGERGQASHGTVVLATASGVRLDPKSGMQVWLWQVRLPGQPEGALVQYQADGWSTEHSEEHWHADRVDPVSMPQPGGRLFAYHVDRWHAPQWWHDAVVYHIFVDRFNAASNEPPLSSHEETHITDHFGGTLAGVIEKLDYIQSLGINCIWLSPVFESPTAHGYNPSDYHNVARRYGSNETLQRLIGDCHRRGIRVLLDFVANHTSDEHPSFVAALRDPDGPTSHWYALNEEGPHPYRSYAQVKNMPELVTEHPDVQRYLNEAALHWLSDFGADGLRLDYVPGPSHAFWTRFQQAIKERFPQAFTIGEITAPLDEIANYAGRMDAFMDFPLAGMLRSVFAQREKTLSALLSYLDERQPALPKGMSTGTLLDNHDMQRFLWLAQGQKERLKLAAACHMTLEGTPIVYYGTEVGLSQYADAHTENAYARAPMLWDERQDQALLEHYRYLIALRHAHPALRHGNRTNLSFELIHCAASDREQIGAYLRQYGSDTIIVILNNDIHSASLLVALPSALPAQATLHPLFPTSTKQTYMLTDRAFRIEVPAMDAVILALP